MIQHSKPTIMLEDIKSVEKVMETGYLSQGNKVKEFEKELSKFIGVKYAIAVNSGTSALHLALLSLDVKENVEVIIPSLTCTALMNAINYVKAKPIIVDIDIDTLNISLDEIKRNITDRTKVVIVPYMFGNVAPIDKIISFCKNYDVKVIEDCAQSVGKKYKGKMLGSFGDVSVFSFYATKVITTGEGGMVLTNSKKIWKNAMDLRSYDKKKTYKMRYNYEMTDMQAALGISQLQKLSTFLSKRKKIAQNYDKYFVSWMPRNSIYYRYLVKVNDADAAIKKLNTLGIESAKCVFEPLKNLKNSSYVYRHAVSIPIYPSLDDNKLGKVIMALKEVIGVQNGKIDS